MEKYNEIHWTKNKMNLNNRKIKIIHTPSPKMHITVHILEETINMKFNVNKFELVRYGKEQEIKTATIYKWYDSNIDSKEQVRYQDRLMSNTATFTFHIIDGLWVIICNNLSVPVFDGVGLRVSRAEPMLSCWHDLLFLFVSYCFIFFFLPWVGCVGLGSLDW